MSAAAADPRFALPQVLFFGIGAQKCGTTWLHQYLSRHPEACMPRRWFKELHYWNALDGDLQDRVQRLLPLAKSDRPGNRLAQVRVKMLRRSDETHGSYADVLFLSYQGQKVVGEITPDYAQLSEERLAQMAALNPDTRFLFLMRDPIDRLHSTMRKRLRGRAGLGRDEPITGDAVLAEFNALIEADNVMPLRRSRYEVTIERLENVTDRSKIGLFFYEDIFGRRDIGPICDFLSISRMPADFDRVANPGNPVIDDRPDAFREAVLPRLAATYEYMENRFGAALPAEWHRARVAA